MHKDQKRVRDALLPFIMDWVMEASPEAERDCTVLNRALLQGPDPLFLMETCPDEFAEACQALALSVESGRDAIEQAHWRGPGILLEEAKGLPFDLQGPFEGIPEAWRREALWLFLASMSDCTEEGYPAHVRLLVRMRRVTAATNRLSRMTYGRTLGDIMCHALTAMKAFRTSTVFVKDERGFVHGEHDHSFYIAYKMGHKVCAVHTSGPTFWGTAPDTSLEANGIKVDKEISPQFGIVLENSKAALASLRVS